jgi:pimeloyl-ACP methyl ester carboxylesterase
LFELTGPGFKKDDAREAWNRRARETGDRYDKEGLAVLSTGSAERAYAVHRSADGLARAARGLLAQKNSAVIESLPNIKVPSIVIVGANDTLFLTASDHMAAKIPGAKNVVIADAGHASNIDQPKAFDDAVVSSRCSVASIITMLECNTRTAIQTGSTTSIQVSNSLGLASFPKRFRA